MAQEVKRDGAIAECFRIFISGVASSWHLLTTSRYTQSLEAEVARLRAENRALINSPLGTGGVPPLRTEAPQQKHRAVENGGMKAAPSRRRSWQQIGRMLEIEEARLLQQKKGGVGVRAAQSAFAEEGGAASQVGTSHGANGQTRFAGGN